MRTVTLDLVKTTPVDHSSTRGECFADALKAATADGRRQSDTAAADGRSSSDTSSTPAADTEAPSKTDAATKADAASRTDSETKTDGTPSDNADFAAAIAMMGSVAAPMCAISPPIDVSGSAPKSPTVDGAPANPSCAQPGTNVDEQRVMPIVAGAEPAAPTPTPDAKIGDPAPTPARAPAALVPASAPPTPAADAAVAVPADSPPAAVITATTADAAAPPVEANAKVDAQHTNRLDTATDETPPSTSPVVDERRPVVVTPLVDAGRASAGDANSSDAALTSALPHSERGNAHRSIGDFDTSVPETSAAGTPVTAPIGQVAVADGITRTAAAKTAQPLTQLSSIVSDLAQQARTDSSPRRVVIPLDPPALGRVTVEIIMRADSVKVSLQHADESTFNALNAQRPAIEAALESNGLHLSDFDVSSHQQQRAAHGRNTNRRFETFAEQVEPDGALRL